MQIVKTPEEVRQATKGLQTVALLLQKKKNFDEIHNGYSYLLNEGRKYGSQIMVSFMYPHVINDFLKESDMNKTTPIMDENGNFNSSLFEWGRDECITWAENNNIDVLWLPDVYDEIDTINVPRFDYYKGLLDRIWKNEGYDKLIDQRYISNRTMNHCLGRLTIGTNWKYLGTWKDGIYMIVLAHFTNKYTDSRYILADPIKAPEGIYYSSSYHSYTQQEKEALAKIEPIIKSFNYNNDLGVLKDNIDVVGKEINLQIKYLNTYVSSEIIGPGQRAVSLTFTLNENTKADIYTFKF